MTKTTPILTNDKALEFACDGLQAHLDLHAEGTKCTTEDLIRALIGASSQGQTLQKTCNALPGLPDVTGIRTYLNTQLTVARLPVVAQQLNAALQAQIPPRVWRKPRAVAIDMHERPYYGKRSQEAGLWVLSRPKASTKRFYRVATAYVMERGLRVTLAVVFMPPDVTTLAALQALLAEVQRLGITVSCLWLDKGFASGPIMQFLDDDQWRAVIACPIRGKREGHGTKALCKGRGSYLTEHTFSKGKDAEYTAQLAVCRVFNTVRRKGRKRRQASWQIFIQIRLKLKPQQVRARYRTRFGIETSYRCANQVRGRTTSPNPVYRFLLMGLAFYVYNVWVHLQWLYTQVPRRGGRYLDTARLRLARLKNFLRQALESHYGAVTFIEATAAPLA